MALTHWKVNVAWIAVVTLAASLLAAFRHLALPKPDLRKASITTLRFRLSEIPGRITQRPTQDRAAPSRRLALDPQPDHRLATSRPCRSRPDPDPDIPTTRNPPLARGTRRHRRDSRIPTLPNERKP